MLSVDHDDETRFLPLQELFDDDTRASWPQFIGDQHHVNGGVRFLQRSGDDYTFACGQAIGLDYDRGTLLSDVFVCRVCIGKGRIRSGWNAMPDHEGFGEILRCLELSGRKGRSENAQA